MNILAFILGFDIQYKKKLCLYILVFSFLDFHTKCGFMRTLQNILQIIFFRQRNGSLKLILLNIFKAISLQIFSEKRSCSLWRSYFALNFLTLSILNFLTKRIDLVLSSPKCMIYQQSTNQPQIFSKFLFNRFSTSLTSSCCYMRHDIHMNQRYYRPQNTTQQKTMKYLINQIVGSLPP